MTEQTNTVAQSALLAAIAAVLGLSALFVPILGVVASVLWSIPIIILVVRFELRTGIMALAVALTIVGLTAGPFGGLSLGLKSGLAALAFGHCLKKGLSPGKTVFWGGITAVAGTGILLLLTFMLMGGSLIEVGEIENTVDQTLAFYERHGLLNPLMEQGVTQEELRGQLLKMMGLVVALIPGAMFLGSLTMAGITYLVARRVLKRLGHSLKAIPPFRHWQVPWYTVWGLILALLLILAGDYLEQKLPLLVGQNIIYIYLPLLLINGLAVITYYYYRWPLSLLVKGLLMAAAIINLPFVAPLLILIGAFDPLFNYRKLSFGTKEGE